MALEITKELLFSHFVREVSPLQREMITQWLQEKANEETYYQWLEEWENRSPQYVSPADNAIHRYTIFLAKNPHPQPVDAHSIAFVPVLPNQLNNRLWMVAACVLLLLGVGTVVFRDRIRYKAYETTFGETRSVLLADGSLITLNANSSLHVPRWGFGQSTREVTLTGEAKFSVIHTPDDRKFVVKTAKNFDVLVLGTEFTVSVRKRGASVVLNKGKVQLHYQEDKITKQVTMKPGELVTLDLHNHIALSTAVKPRLRVAWDTKRFVFDETTLEEVAYLLEDNYGLQVDIRNRELAERRLMGSFRADNVDQLLQSISELLDVSVVRQGIYVQISSR